MKKLSFLLATAAVLAVALFSIGAAQAPRPTFTATVKWASGAAIAGATLQDVDNGYALLGVTDGNGEAQITTQIGHRIKATEPTYGDSKTETYTGGSAIIVAIEDHP